MSGPRLSRSLWLVIGAVVSLWLWSRPLQWEWRLNPAYEHGFLVPFLAGYLAWLRWQDQPPMDIQPRRAWMLAPLVWALLTLVCGIGLEANPEWRLLLAGQSMLFVGAWMAGLVWLGGWRWARHWFFPLFFLMLAVPWPSDLENAVVQKASRAVALVAAEGMRWLGSPAEARGNVVVLPQVSVEVEEACSGIRSLQALLMAALFLGELRRATIAQRLWLALAGMLTALALNLARAIVLAILAQSRGATSIETFHDVAGYAALLLGAFLLWRVAKWMTPRPVKAVEILPQRATLAPQAALWVRAVLAGQIFTVIVVHWWYAGGGGAINPGGRWVLRLPLGTEGCKPTQLGLRVQTQLRCDQSAAAVWDKADGQRWRFFDLGWVAGRVSAILATAHRPEVCLPAVGWVWARNEPPILLQLPNGPAWEIQASQFYRGPDQLQVFHLVNRGGAEAGSSQAPPFLRRWRNAWSGRRPGAFQVLEVTVERAPNHASAAREVAAFLRGNMRWAPEN